MCISLYVDADDFCQICWTENLAAAPCIRTTCGHVFHAHCARELMERKWGGPEIKFGFLDCPICKKDLAHPALEEVLAPILQVIRAL